MTFSPPSGLGAVIAIVVLCLCIVLAVTSGPTVTLGLIGTLAISRLT